MRALTALFALCTPLAACDQVEAPYGELQLQDSAPYEVGEVETQPDEDTSPDWSIEETLGGGPGGVEEADEAEVWDGSELKPPGCEALANLPPGDTNGVALRIACAVWEDQGLENYSYELWAWGPAAAHQGLAIVEVRDNQVHQVMFEDGEHGLTSDFHTIDEMFQWVGMSLAAPAVEVELAFHPDNGAPLVTAVYLGASLTPIYAQRLAFSFDLYPEERI